MWSESDRENCNNAKEEYDAIRRPLGIEWKRGKRPTKRGGETTTQHYAKRSAKYGRRLWVNCLSA